MVTTIDELIINPERYHFAHLKRAVHGVCVTRSGWGLNTSIHPGQ